MRSLVRSHTRAGELIMLQHRAWARRAALCRGKAAAAAACARRAPPKKNGAAGQIKPRADCGARPAPTPA